MMKKRMTIKRLIYVLLLLGVMTSSSCVFSAIEMKNKNKNKDSKKPAKLVEKKTESTKPLYYDFKDILVPGELTEDKRHSSVIGTGDNARGFISFYGRVELRSVVHFFEVKVPEDGWKMVSVIKSPFSTNMIFHKDKRWCLITLREKGFTTEVGIGVSSEL